MMIYTNRFDGGDPVDGIVCRCYDFLAHRWFRQFAHIERPQSIMIVLAEARHRGQSAKYRNLITFFLYAECDLWCQSSIIGAPRCSFMVLWILCFYLQPNWVLISSSLALFFSCHAQYAHELNEREGKRWWAMDKWALNIVLTMIMVSTYGLSACSLALFDMRVREPFIVPLSCCTHANLFAVTIDLITQSSFQSWHSVRQIRRIFHIHIHIYIYAFTFLYIYACRWIRKTEEKKTSNENIS